METETEMSEGFNQQLESAWVIAFAPAFQVESVAGTNTVIPKDVIEIFRN